MAQKGDQETGPLLPSGKPVQHPEYEKAPMSRRQLLKRVAAVAGLGGAAGYLAWAPDDRPPSLKDPTGPRRLPRGTPGRWVGMQLGFTLRAALLQVGADRLAEGADGHDEDADVPQVEALLRIFPGRVRRRGPPNTPALSATDAVAASAVVVLPEVFLKTNKRGITNIKVCTESRHLNATQTEVVVLLFNIHDSIDKGCNLELIRVRLQRLTFLCAISQSSALPFDGVCID